MIIVSVLFGCRQIVRGHQPAPIRTETAEFDIETAIKMISPGEKIFADMGKKDTATREEFEQFLIDIKNMYPDHMDNNWELMFFDNREFENKDVKVLSLHKNLFYPTIYHQGIEIVSAYSETTFYKDAFLNFTMLHIYEKYTGDDPKMADWSKEYIFIKRNNGEWAFGSGVGGNIRKEGINNHYLPFK